MEIFFEILEYVILFVVFSAVLAVFVTLLAEALKALTSNDD